MNGCPSELNAVSSDFSESWPVNIMEPSKMASGRAMGIKVIVEYHNNSTTINHSNPFPIKSSIYFHKNCINKITTIMDNVKKNGRKNDEKINFLKMFTLK